MQNRLPAAPEIHRAPATIFSECSTQPRAGDMARPHGPRLDTRIHEPLTGQPPAIPGVGGSHFSALVPAQGGQGCEDERGEPFVPGEDEARDGDGFGAVLRFALALIASWAFFAILWVVTP